MAAGMLFGEDDDSIRVAVGQGTEQDAVDHGEDGRVHADGERERRQRGERESGRAYHQAQRVTKVLDDGIHGCSWSASVEPDARRPDERASIMDNQSRAVHLVNYTLIM
jgi:hypothetical protein